MIQTAKSSYVVCSAIVQLTYFYTKCNLKFKQSFTALERFLILAYVTAFALLTVVVYYP